VRPQNVDIYTIARRPARETLQPVAAAVLEGIAARVGDLGIPARVIV